VNEPSKGLWSDLLWSKFIMKSIQHYIKDTVAESTVPFTIPWASLIVSHIHPCCGPKIDVSEKKKKQLSNAWINFKNILKRNLFDFDWGEIWENENTLSILSKKKRKRKEGDYAKNSYFQLVTDWISKTEIF
jgi:hypothetical protein